MIKRYAQLLVDYCLEIKEGEKLFISTSVLAEPLVREVYRAAMQRGAHVISDLSWSGQSRIFYQEAKEDQLSWANPLIQEVYQHFDACLFIRAPYNLREDQSIDPEKRAFRGQALRSLHDIYNQRTAERSLRRCLCQFPTQAAAQEADMSLEEYEDFVFHACRLNEKDPSSSWMDVRASQQRLVDFLNRSDLIRYQNAKSDLTFSVKGRTWINSDGQTNMPSGEVFTAPIENSVNGHIHFDYPSVFRGHEVAGITLWVDQGEVVKWDAERGMDLLEQVFAIEGARRFGEVAIGTNYHIQRSTKNILFDEKIGGTVHMAVGQSYIQTGGVNQSPIHWDMIADMSKDGRIMADGKEIYRNGLFTI